MSIITAILLWQKRSWGYALLAVFLVKGMMMGAALNGMIIAQTIANIQYDPVIAALFVAITGSGIILTIFMLRSIKDN